MNALTLPAATLPRVDAHAHRRTSTHAGLLERAFAVVVLFLATGGLLPLLRLENGIDLDDLEGDPVMQITWGAVYAITLVLLSTRGREIFRLLSRERWLVLLCGLAAVSVMWSVAPDVTFRRTVALFGTTAFGVYLASRYSVHDLLRLLGWVLTAIVVLSVVTVFFFPNHGISPEDGTWRGIFVHKNALGRAMALACLAFLFRVCQRGIANRLASLALLLLAVVALLGSRSVAGLLTAVTVAVTMPLWPVFRLRRTLMVAAAVFILIVVGGSAIWLITASDVMVSAVGKDPSLTGRAGLWLAVVESIATRPWLGHGYSAFWLGWGGESATIWRTLEWRPPHAHNGFLDLGLELGGVGIALFVVGLATALGRSAVVIRRTATAYGLWPIAYLMFIVMINLAESTIMVRNGVFWMLYVVTCIWLIRHGSERRSA